METLNLRNLSRSETTDFDLLIQISSILSPQYVAFFATNVLYWIQTIIGGAIWKTPFY